MAGAEETPGPAGAPGAKEGGEGDVVEIGCGALRARICRYGASVMNLWVPDSTGKPRDVVLGLASPEEYFSNNSPYFGCVVGRVANRIGDATFALDGVTHCLPANHGPNTLHGGPVGFNRHLWSVDASSQTDSSVTLTMTSPDKDQGFPGAVRASVTYTLRHPGELLICMEAQALTQRTPISLAHHMYWNLAGHASGTILDHKLRLRASAYTPVGPTLIPTGEILLTAGTPFDFAQETVIGSRIADVPGGYDHNYIVDPGSPGQPAKEAGGLPLAPVASVACEASGLRMEVHATAPGVQFYSGNFLDGTLRGKEGVSYQRHAGFCLETQGYPNAVNEKKFPSVIVAPGETYKHVMLISFSC